MAFLLDSVVLIVALALALWALPISGETAYWIGFLIAFFFPISLPLLAIVFGIAFASIEWAWRGRSFGKALLGLQLRNAYDGRDPSLGRLLSRETWRALYAILFIVPAFLDALAALRDPQRRAWHDLRGGTVVVRSRTRRSTLLGAATVVPALAAFAFAIYQIRAEPANYAHQQGKEACAEYAARRGVPRTTVRANEIANSLLETRLDFGEIGDTTQERQAFLNGCREAWRMDAG